MSYKELADQLGLDEEDFAELVELFITTSREDIEKVRQGMAGNDPAGAAAASHSIKGAAGNLGFEAVAALALKMEMQAKDGSLEGFDAYVNEMAAQLDVLENQ